MEARPHPFPLPRGEGEDLANGMAGLVLFREAWAQAEIGFCGSALRAASGRATYWRALA